MGFLTDENGKLSTTRVTAMAMVAAVGLVVWRAEPYPPEYIVDAIVTLAGWALGVAGARVGLKTFKKGGAGE